MLPDNREGPPGPHCLPRSRAPCFHLGIRGFHKGSSATGPQGGCRLLTLSRGIVMQCVDCGAEMVEGFVPDVSYGTILQTCWHAQSPEVKTFLGVKTGGVRFQRSATIPISVHRCTGCGVLKSYALYPAD